MTEEEKVMKEFLYELAEKVYQENKKLDTVTVVFPNRRAILYFRKHLTSLLRKPAFSPELLTIEEFIGRFSTSKVPDKLLLLKTLYHCYSDVYTQHYGENNQSFSDFYFWGEMLLRDFEEIDKYLVEASQLFVDLTNQKEIETIFEFLSEEQVAFLKEFVGNFNEHPSLKKDQFLRVWKMLFEVYTSFRGELKKQRIAYGGMLHREVAETIAANESVSVYKNRKLYFAGFNALTLAEETILTYFVGSVDASIEWDADAYYLNDKNQEAGTFFREYQGKSVLGKTFPAQVPASIHQKIADQTIVHAIGAAQPIGQVKIMAALLEAQLQKGWKPEETLIVLPDEKLLLPTLHSIPSSISKLNVTMGFPLASSPVFNLVELLFELQLTVTDQGFHHRPVLALLQHPYSFLMWGDTTSIRKQIVEKNWVYIPEEVVAEWPEFLRSAIQKMEEKHLLLYLREGVERVGQSAVSDVDKEFAFHFYTFLNRVEEIASHELLDDARDRKRVIQSTQRLVQQLARSERIPFAGEPLQGLQIMGVLETRNLDYKNVMVLSLNEGSLPASASKGSYIPYNLRKGYGLPTAAHQDAMYSYLFYRVLQRAENVYLFYNTETDVLGQGEMSRYLQQLIFESGLQIEQQVVHNTIQPKTPSPIVIRKNKEVLEKLMMRNEKKGFSPSALSNYLECRLKFYLKHIADIREVKEVEEDLDNRIVGNLLHKTIEEFYKVVQRRKRSATIEEQDLETYKTDLPLILHKVFREHYGLHESKPVDYKGQRLVVREIVKRFAERIVELDKEYAPFQLEALERNDLTYSINIDHAPYAVSLSGIVDRADRKGNVLRVVDYKTGRDEARFKSIESLFDRSASKEDKASFQTMLYALLFSREVKDRSVKLRPGLLSRRGIFDSAFEFGLRMGKERVDDAWVLLPEFEENLKGMLNELYNPETVFDQTDKEDTCKYCEFKNICYKQ